MSAERRQGCRKCARPLPESARPRSYCSVGCRRAAEHEVRRLDRALASTEDSVRFARVNRRPPDVVARMELEVQMLEQRLRDLLDDEP